MKPTSGRVWATLGFIVGVIASVSANVAHSYVKGSPPKGAIVAAAFWPMALLISLEVISRITWPTGVMWWLTRYAGLTTVAVIAAIVSYRHMAGLLTSYGEDGFSASIGPLAVDGLMVVCSVALLAVADNRRRAAETIMPTAETIITPETMAEEAVLTEQQPATETAPRPPVNPLYAQAVQSYQESLAGGTPLSGKALGELFKRSERWGRDRIAEARS